MTLSLALLVPMANPANAQRDRGGFASFGGGGGDNSGASDQPWKDFKLNSKTRVSLNFHNSNIDSVLQYLSQSSGITIVKDPTLTGGITLVSPTPQSLSDAFAMLSAALSLRNYDLAKDNNFLIIRGRGSSRSGRFDASQLPQIFNNPDTTTPTISLQVYPIKYANASQLARVINEVFAVNQQTGAPVPTPSATFQRGNRGNRGSGFGGRFGGLGGNGGFQGFGNRGGSTAAAGTVVHASADDYSNSVVVNAPRELQPQVQDLIDQLDRQTDQPQQSKVYPLKFANATDLLSGVQNVLVSNAPRGRGGIGNSSQTVPLDQRFQAARAAGSSSAAFGTVVAEPRTNSLIVTATAENLVLVGKVVDQLDKPITYVDNTFIFTLQNARADVVAQILNTSFQNRTNNTNTNYLGNRTITTAGSVSSNGNRITGGAGSNALGNGGRAEAIPGQETKQTKAGATRAASMPGDAASQAAAAQAEAAATGQFGGFGGFGGGGFGGNRQNNQRNTTTVQSGIDDQGHIVNIRDLSGDVTIIPDVNTNSVVVVTSPQNRAVIEGLLKQLDRIPQQVMIETLIVEASLEDTQKLGIEWNLGPSKAFGDKSATNTTNQSFGLQTTTNNTQPRGLEYTLTAGQYGAFLQAVQTDQNFEVLSTPRIFTSNNATAQINISQSLPYVLSQTTDATTGTILYNYSFLDVGIVLTVTPRITSNGYVTMDVTQTANDFVNYTSFNAPVVNQREAQTTVSVKDGETVVLGGIIDNTTSKTDNKVPILGDLPIVGNLFRSHTHDKKKTELLVFLTPRVVRDAQEADQLRETTEKQLDKRTLQRLLDSRKPPADEGTATSTDSTKGTAPPGSPPSVPPSTLPGSLPPPPAPAAPINNTPPATAPSTAPTTTPTPVPGSTQPTPAAPAPATTPAVPTTTPATPNTGGQ